MKTQKKAPAKPKSPEQRKLPPVEKAIRAVRKKHSHEIRRLAAHFMAWRVRQRDK
jgi:hypothetical protein